MLRVEDASNIPDEEKKELVELYDKLGLTLVISEKHFIISSDTMHDNAFIWKGLDDHIIPYILRELPNTSCLHVRSDGCKGRAVWS